ncbi:unnamed protein product [Sphenostylis stenocarpa]|uniref:Uncharacterized protein n=1 Tax=Sphenostylis stenocarpa TaxID=92480 RepID=A0AA86SG00_9FABA|nr:unnamed protein product [Sphenostylis stenocarpa]
MAISMLFNSLSNDPNGYLPYPWQRILDIPTKLVYYHDYETGFVIYDFRPFVDFGGGVFLENDIGFSLTDDEVLEQINNNLQDFLSAPRLLLFVCACSGRNYYGVVEQPVVRCPLCKRITSLFP